MGKYFGTDGFRGKANVDITAIHAFKIGRFLGWYLTNIKGERARIVIGKDTRRSSYMLEYALSSGITASGADAYLLHVTTTPSVAYITVTDGFDSGIMISASHNPYYDNGIKIMNSKGEKQSDELLSLIEDYLDGKSDFTKENGDLPLAKDEKIGRTFDYFSGRNRYIAYLISIATDCFKNIRVGLDCSNGSTWNIAKSVFDALGAKTYVISAEPDGTNINLDCGSVHPEKLQRLVKEENLDIGFAFDGDGDRCVCVDEKGELVDGDGIMYICGKYLKEKGRLKNDTVVTTVMSNFGLYKAFDEIGIKTEKTAVGDRFVHERMAEKGYSLGGEQSGHIICSKYATTGDGVLTALMVMEVLTEKRKPLSNLLNGFERFPQRLINVRVRDKKAALQNAELQKAEKEINRELSGVGRVLIRESGTEPVIRVMVECESEEKCEAFCTRLSSTLEGW
ncbi:MAG: phosphoglucosamine mutase [Clostridia bacterium]|nr:phosphoglucosamine mutase [Clostridia bacterium]